MNKKINAWCFFTALFIIIVFSDGWISKGTGLFCLFMMMAFHFALLDEQSEEGKGEDETNKV